MTLIATNHAIERAKERFGWNEATLMRMMEKAEKHGLRHTDVKAKLKRYVSKLFLEHGQANNIRIYGETVFLFSKDTLITLYQIDNSLKKYVKINRDSKA